jgi:ABC-type Zn uptake system ZnuABC Zn-binding protein ZnuA
MTRKKAALSAIFVALVTGAIGCGQIGVTSKIPRSDKEKVVVTTPLVGDFVRKVGGDHVTVTTLLAPNSDPHVYEPRPNDMQALQDSALIIRSGGEIDIWLNDLTTNREQGQIIDLIRYMPTTANSHSHTDSGETGSAAVDPHWWQDPHNVERAVRVIRDQLIKLDPAHETTYRRNSSTYLQQLQHYDRAVQACINQLPLRRRKLVTSHDALEQYAHRYQLDVVGTTLPSRAAKAQPSAGEIAQLITRIQRTGVSAIFPEQGQTAKLEETVAQAAGIRLGKPLWTDSLGGPDSEVTTYLELLQANTEAIVAGLGDSDWSCEFPDTTDRPV